ncbi:UNVERIFIED_ORG: hypothetical protein OKW15_004946 [Pseudomonas reinekei]|nr:hypothetical protein [Pseudomonas reinekei]
MDSSAPRLCRFTRVIVNDHRWQASSYRGPRLSSSHALSLTTIAGKPAPARERVCRRQLAGNGWPSGRRATRLWSGGRLADQRGQAFDVVLLG